MSADERRIGILGGTFDPIHVGHLAVAGAAAGALALDEILFIPSYHPPHRLSEPEASSHHRFAMVAMAICGCERLVASDMELAHDRWSYTSDTLERLHARGLAAWQIFFLTGADAFAEIATWHRYPEVVGLANFVVVARPGASLRELPSRLPDLASRMTMLGAGARPPALDRAAPTRILLIDAATPDVSSTEIRRRAAAGAPLDGLVPDAVARHILQHALYRPPMPLGGGEAGAGTRP